MPFSAPRVKVDLLKSALEINHSKISSPMLRKDEKNSDQSMRSIHAESAPKLHSHYGSKNISQSRIEVLDEAEVRALMSVHVAAACCVWFLGFHQLINALNCLDN